VSEVTSCDARDRVEEGRGEAEVTGGGACRGVAEEEGREMGMGARGGFFFFVGLGASQAKAREVGVWEGGGGGR